MKLPALDYWKTAAVLSVWAAAARTSVRVYSDETPANYAGQTFLLHLGLFLALALAVGAAGLGVAGLFRRRETGQLPRLLPLLQLGALFAIYTALGFEAGWGHLRRLEGSPIWHELSRWLPGALAWAAAVLVLALLTPARRKAAAWLGTTLCVIAVAAIHLVADDGRAELAATSPRSESAPPVIVILIDTLRADHLGVYGYDLPTSLSLDRFAEDATVYTHAYSTSPWTRPACASLMTSRLPSQLGIRDRDDALPGAVPLWSELMAREGYETSAIVANVQAGPVFGFHRGFHHFDIGPSFLRYTGARVALSRLRLIDYRDIYPRYDARALTGRAIERLERRDVAHPPFLYLHYADPHGPYLPPAADDRWREFATPAALEVQEPPFSPFFWPHGKVEGPALEAMVARYDAEIAFVDAQIGRLLEYLKEIDLYEKAWIVVTSDHGEEFQDHGGWNHGSTLYNELIRIPLLVKYPAGTAQPGRRIDAPVSLVDLLPTAKQLLGARWPDGDFVGRSLLSEHDHAERTLYAETSDNASLRLALYKRRKLIQKIGKSDGNDDGTSEEVIQERVYDLDRDAQEKEPLRPEDAFTWSELQKLRTWLAERHAAAESSAAELDDATLEELRSLGYVD